MSLNNVLITGSSNGLGYHLSLYFSKKGHNILLHGRDEKKLKQTQDEIKKYGVKVKYFVADLEKDEDIKDLCKYAKKDNIQILINNAGILCPNLAFHNFSNDTINSMLKVNLLAPIKILNLLSKNLKHVININSMVGLEAKKNRTLYAASKWGLKGFSDSLKQEKTEYNILDVYPTNIKTYPEKDNAMDVNFVIKKIYQAMLDCKKDLILDGRIK